MRTKPIHPIRSKVKCQHLRAMNEFDGKENKVLCKPCRVTFRGENTTNFYTFLFYSP